MTRLSVNVNKIATLRNARGGNNPDVEKMAADCFYVLKKERLRLLLEKKQDEIKSAEKRGESIRLLLTDYQKLLQQKKDLDRKGG